MAANRKTTFIVPPKTAKNPKCSRIWRGIWIKEPLINQGSKLTGSFGGWRRCSSVEEPRGIFSFVAPCQPPKYVRHLATLIY
jgi:hypothetical protein